MPNALGNRLGFASEKREKNLDIEKEMGLTVADSQLFWIVWALLPQTQAQLHSDRSDGCGIARRWNDNCRVAKCGSDNCAHGLQTRPKFLQTTDNDQPGSAGSTGGGLKILLPEYKNQELNKGLTEAQEQAAGDRQ